MTHLPQTTLHSVLMSLSRIYSQTTGRSLARLSTIVAKDGKMLARIESGGSCTVTMFDRFVTFFRDQENWGAHPIPAEAQSILTALEAVGDADAIASRSVAA